MIWDYIQPVQICFGVDRRLEVAKLARSFGMTRAVLVCDRILYENKLAEELQNACGGLIVGVFTDISPNPTTDNVDACAELLRQTEADGVIAMGGGSSMDCAKAACGIARTRDSIVKYHGTGVPLPEAALPLIALPSTAGTGSEVTCVSVLSNEETGVKAPLLSPRFYAKAAIVDPVLTYSLPRKVAAVTGFDVLSHAIEGYYSVNHQPITDAMCVSAARDVFTYLERACAEELDAEAKERMAQASLIAGLGFNLPKTGPSHACSFILTNRYHIPHGEACILTQDYFVRVIAAADGGRMDEFAHLLGFGSADEMADEIAAMKGRLGVRRDLKDLKLSDADVDDLVEKSRHPNMKNSPVEITDEILYKMYRDFQ